MPANINLLKKTTNNRSGFNLVLENSYGMIIIKENRHMKKGLGLGFRTGP
jgi:hypothetical protein